MTNYSKIIQGFTLVELIVVMVVSSILAVGTTMFIMQAVRGYVDVAGRDDLATSGRIAIERMTREIRDALPNSVRTSNSTGYKCLEFIPIANAGLYASEVINQNATDKNNTLPTNSTFTGNYPFSAYGNELDNNNATYVAIYPVNTDACYTTNSSLPETPPVGHLRSVNATNATHVTFTSVPGRAFPENEYGSPPQPRFFLVKNPVSFCLKDDGATGELYRYAGYNLATDQPDPPDSVYRRLLAKNVVFNDSSFEYTDNPALTRNGMVRINLALQRPDDSGEVIRFSHEVQIRNAP
jgi:MSHA biogenesis protein MshO